MDNTLNHPIFPFLWMRGEPEDVLRNELQKIHGCGISGVCIESRPHPDFLGPGWWHDMDIVMEEAKRLDMQVWILDDAHFPTGYAGGAVKDHPELGKVYLFRSFADAVGPAPSCELDCKALCGKAFTAEDLFMTPKPPLMMEDHIVSVTARRFAGGTALSEDFLDLTGRVGEDGIARFDLPAGQWRFCVVFTTRSGGGDPEYLNPLEPEAVRLLIDAVYEPHYARYGKALAGFFSDEPCMGNVAGYGFDNAIGRKQMNLPWCAALPAALEKRLGPDWLTLLPFLWADSADEKTAAKVRLAYMDEMTKIHARTFSGQLGGWCAERGLEYVGHVVEDNGVHCRLGCGPGHYFRSTDGQHMAGIDIIGTQVTRGSGTQVRYGFGVADGAFFQHALPAMGASAAMLDPKKQGRLMCELYGAYGWTFGVRDMKWLTDFLVCRGVNRLVPHAFSMAEYPDRDCPPHFYARGHNAQYPHFGALMRYADGLCRRFSGGVGGAKTAVLYPGECEWMGDCMQTETVGAALDASQVDFWVLPEDSLEGPFPENVVIALTVIPATRFLTVKAARALAKRPAESVAFVDTRPVCIPEADAAEEKQLLDALSACPVVSLDELGTYCANRGLAAAALTPAFAQVHVYRYLKDGVWDYMVFNESADAAFEGTVTLPGGQAVPLTLHPFDSALFHGGVLDQTASVPSLDGAERLDLSRGWAVSLARSGDEFGAAEPMDPLVPVSQAHPRFAGVMRYEREVELEKAPAAAVLEVQWLFETADIYVDDQKVATRLTPPYRFDLTGALHSGVNRLRMEVTAPPARDTLNYDLGPFGASRDLIEPTGMFGDIWLEIK